MDAYETDLIIASEAGFAAEMGNDIDPLTAQLQAMTSDEFHAFVMVRCKDVIADADDTVPAAWACPNCHESHVDMLTIDQDEDGNALDEVTCEHCGLHYEIEVAPVKGAWDENERDEVVNTCIEPY
jgi:transcription elongation factor Elf1